MRLASTSKSRLAGWLSRFILRCQGKRSSEQWQEHKVVDANLIPKEIGGYGIYKGGPK